MTETELAHIQRADRLRKAMERIAYMRPPGDIETARNTRSLVKRIEAIAIKAIEEDQIA